MTSHVNIIRALGAYWVFCCLWTLIVVALPASIEFETSMYTLFYDKHVRALIDWKHVVRSRIDYSDTSFDVFVQVVMAINNTFVSHLPEFSCLTLAHMVLPTLSGLVYTFMPLWLLELSQQGLGFLSANDSEPPELELDPTYMHNSMHSTAFSSGNAPDDLDTAYVFDPTYGVVPRGLRDLWKKQEREAMVKKDRLTSSATKRVVPPVRYSRDRGPMVSSIKSQQ